MYAMEWFTTTFVYSLRFSCAVYILDIVLLTDVPDPMYLAGVTTLTCLSDRLMKMDGNAIMENFRAMAKAIEIDEFRAAYMNYHRLVPSTLIKGDQQTLMLIANDFANPRNEIGPDYDASAMYDAVQVGDDAIVEMEVEKYKFPPDVMERALFERAY